MKRVKEMDKKKKIYLGVLVTSLITLVVGISFAYISYTAKQTSTNTIGTSCVKVTLSDVTKPISLDKAYPLKDSEAEQLTPYTFKIENNCDTPVTYKVDLDVLNTDKPTPLSDLAIQIDNNTKRILNSLDNSDNLIENAYAAKVILGSGVLNVGSSIEHSIKIWLDETASNDSQNTTHNSKVVVTATQDTSLEVKDVMSSFMNETVYLTYKTFGSVDNVSCKYGLTEDNLDQNGTNITKTSCELNPTNPNTTYYYEVCLTTSSGVNKCIKDTVDTKPVEGTLTEDSIEIPLTSGTNITCKYSTEENVYTTEGTIEDNKCKITPIEQGKTYYYQICSTNELGNRSCSIGKQATEVPKLTLYNTIPTDTSLKIYFKAEGTELTINCKGGTDRDNMTIVGEIVDNYCLLDGLESNKNYYYELNVTNKYGGTTSHNNSRFTVNPTISLNEVRVKSNSASLEFDTTGTDLITTCKYGTTEGNLNNSIIAKDNKCVINGLSSNRTYYYEIETVNKNKVSVSTTGNFSTSSVNISNNVNIGDYIAYTPSKTSYDISNTLTGMNGYAFANNPPLGIKNAGKQTINPSELNLWRVIKKNSEGTIEIASVNISTTPILFWGEEGYRRLVGTLNTIASAYETTGITTGSRCVGNNGEPSTCSTYKTCTNTQNDIKYKTPDEILLNNIGALRTEKGNGATYSYWVASRFYGPYWGDDTCSHWFGISVWDATYKSIESLVYCTTGENVSSDNTGFRPIVILKSGLTSPKGYRNGKNLWVVN